jgi:hypothetical protein
MIYGLIIFVYYKLQIIWLLQSLWLHNHYVIIIIFIIYVYVIVIM